MRKGKKKVGFRWWSDWTVLWIFGGVVLAYFVFIPLEVHPLHWLFTVLGGFVGYGIGLFVDTGLPSIVGFVRRGSRRAIVKQYGGRQVKRGR